MRETVRLHGTNTASNGTAEGTHEHRIIDSVIASTSGLSASAAMVLLLLHRHGDDHGRVTLSLPRIASALNVTYVTAQAAVKRLIEGGHATRVSGGEDGRPSVYALNVSRDTLTDDR